MRQWKYAKRFCRLGAVTLPWVLIIGLGAASRAEEAADPKAHVQFYIKNYGGEVDRQADPQVARAYGIFERVRQVADNPGQRLPQLKVINSANDPWAIALPDGFIVLSRRAVEIAYRDASLSEGDARMAFILGHELAHLAKDDYWHLNVYRALAGDPDPEAAKLRHDLEVSADVAGDRSAARVKEAEADDRGFLYAGLAGYRVDTLLGEAKAGKADFFQHWMSQTHTGVDEAHPSPAERAKLLKVRLAKLQSQLDFFHYGVRLSHFGAYEDAEYFLRQFQGVFPGREVANNLGYGYLQRARQLMPASLAYRYCLPTLLDTETRAASLTLRGGVPRATELPDKARDLLKTAIDYLQRAATADATYLPARLNLAVAYGYLGEVYKTRAVIEEARALAPEDREVQNLRALILYQEGWDTDTWPNALQLLEDLAAQPQASACLTYNLAQILEERQRDAKAQAVWDKLAPRLAELPPPYRQSVCTHTPNAPACQASDTAAPIAAPPWPLPVALGLDLTAEPGPGAQVFNGWTATDFDWQHKDLYGHLYRSPQGASVLELADYVEMVVLAGDGLGTEDTLRSCCGTPTLQQAVTGGTLWSYGNRWAALVRDGQVAEVWIARQQAGAEAR